MASVLDYASLREKALLVERITSPLDIGGLNYTELPWDIELQLLLEIECASFHQTADWVELDGRRDGDALTWRVRLHNRPTREHEAIRLLSTYPDLSEKQRVFCARALLGDRRAAAQCIAYLRHLIAQQVYGEEG